MGCVKEEEGGGEMGFRGVDCSGGLGSRCLIGRSGMVFLKWKVESR